MRAARAGPAVPDPAQPVAPELGGMVAQADAANRYGMKHDDEATPFCAECKEDFPVAAGEPFRMGALKPLAECSPRWRQRFNSWVDHPEGAYLCGNCYFDLTDAD